LSQSTGGQRQGKTRGGGNESGNKRLNFYVTHGVRYRDVGRSCMKRLAAYAELKQGAGKTGVAELTVEGRLQLPPREH
jgi:hypothetical protein